MKRCAIKCESGKRSRGENLNRSEQARAGVISSYVYVFGA
jgi:hypothetical protein